MRIDKYLQKHGYGTKEKIHSIIQDKKVSINGIIIDNFHYQVFEDDDVIVDSAIEKYKDYIYLMMYKPEGYVSSTKDKNNKTIFSLLDEKYQNIGLNIVGRLDKDVTGLLLLTNNNKLYKYLLDPKNKIEKKYLVSYTGSNKFINQDISKGITLDDGTKTEPFKLEFIDDQEAYITLHEGKYHEVKNIFSSLHMRVIDLKRISIGNLSLKDVEIGKVRELTKSEIDLLLLN